MPFSDKGDSRGKKSSFLFFDLSHSFKQKVKRQIINLVLEMLYLK